MIDRRTVLTGGLAAAAASLAALRGGLFASEPRAAVEWPTREFAPQAKPTHCVLIELDVDMLRDLAVGDRIQLPAPVPHGHAAATPIDVVLNEVAHLDDGRYTTVWGTFAVPTGAPRRTRGRGLGEFLLARLGDRVGGLVVDRRGAGPAVAYLLSPADAAGVSHATFHRVPPLQPCAPAAVTNSCDHDWALPASHYAPRSERPRVVEVAFLYTARAVLDTGGCREHFKHCLAAARDTAREAFRNPDVNILLDADLALLSPEDDARSSPRDLWERARAGDAEPWGRALSSAYRAASRPRIVALLTGRARDASHGYATIAEPASASVREPILAVVSSGELRHADLSLAHELGHALGYEHAPRSGSAGTIMSVGVTRRRRELTAR